MENSTEEYVIPDYVRIERIHAKGDPLVRSTYMMRMRCILCEHTVEEQVVSANRPAMEPFDEEHINILEKRYSQHYGMHMLTHYWDIQEMLKPKLMPQLPKIRKMTLKERIIHVFYPSRRKYDT